MYILLQNYFYNLFLKCIAAECCWGMISCIHVLPLLLQCIVSFNIPSMEDFNHSFVDAAHQLVGLYLKSAYIHIWHNLSTSPFLICQYNTRN